MVQSAFVEVRLARVCAQCRITDAEADWLGPDERARAAAFANEGHARFYEVAHVFLRRSLGDVLGVDPASLQFRAAHGGKPVLAGEGAALSFSLSHTRDCVACAISRDCEVGTDVETLAHLPDDDNLQAFVLHPLEMAQLRGAAPERALLFGRFWTAKEAVLKALGVGLSIAPRRLGFALRDDGGAALAEYPVEHFPGGPPFVQGGVLQGEEGTSELCFCVAALAREVDLRVSVLTGTAGCPCQTGAGRYSTVRGREESANGYLQALC